MDALEHARTLVRGADTQLDPLDAPLSQLARPVPPAPAPRAPRTWERLAAAAAGGAQAAASAAEPGDSGAAGILVRYAEQTHPEDVEMQLSLLQGAVEALGEPDAEQASTSIAELLGFSQLDLVPALLANASATRALLQRRIRDKEHARGRTEPSVAPPADLSQASQNEAQYPHVFASGEHGSMLTAFGSRFALPAGTQRYHEQYYEEVVVPPSSAMPMRADERIIDVREMDPICQGAFRKYERLNRLQSAVYPQAYGTSENLLVCAPTGAGKTDVAMLAVLQCIGRFARVGRPGGSGGPPPIHVDRNAFKIVYVAPMKALVGEIVGKFAKRLSYLGIRVRELTGDMQLTRREMAETQMIVTTPEKWDVVTRKPTGNGELALAVRLLIIDEVHLLHESRGAVIETIVARTQRLVEATQSMTRIVGLSATLPNYVDVADFLGVNRYRGLFYFGSAFRPVPLQQHFIGVRGKSGSAQARSGLDRVVYERVLQLAEEQHPVMVFVHTRKDTVRTAQALLEHGREDGLSALLTEPRGDDTRFARDVGMSRNRELRELYEHGIGIHHAGMLRSDRDLSERMFESGATRVLCCTATLAWGVNLPAYAVMIKGTDVYNAEAGRFVDLSILDVLQIFGRAGRPQYEDLGVSYICTGGDKLSHYIDAITASHPIESSFLGGLVDALNAEVALGTVSSVGEGVSWLGYTYLYTRAKKAPLVYGIDFAELAEDPALEARRRHWITSAARTLAEHQMATFDADSGTLTPTNVGRIAARFYLGYPSVGTFLGKLRNGLREADALDLMSRAADFEQVPLRETEERELASLQDRIPCEVPDGTKTAKGKVNILLQAHISNLFIEDFALVADGRYVSANAGRVLRALFELALDRALASAAFALLNLAKAVEARVWPFEHPLRQDTTLHADVVHRIVSYADELEVSQLRALERPQLAQLLHTNERTAGVVHDAAARFPRLAVQVRVRPLTDTTACLHVALRRDFVWDERVHGAVLPLVFWVEDARQRAVHAQSLELRNTPQPAGSAEGDAYADVVLDVAVPCHVPALRGDAELAYTVVWASDHWLGADGQVRVEMDDVQCPAPSPPTPLLELPLLELGACVEAHVADAYAQTCGVRAWNALQTQAFHTVAHTRASALLCAPPGSGMRTLAELAIWRAVRAPRARTALVVVPTENAAQTYHARLGRLAPLCAPHAQIELLLGRAHPRTAPVAVTTPRWLLQHADLDLPPGAVAVLHDMHCLDATYELAVATLLRRDDMRIVATAASMYDAASLARWLRVAPSATYAFARADRPYPVRAAIEALEVTHFEGVVRGGVKPAYDQMRSALAHGPGLVVVPSTRLCVVAARELLARIATSVGLGLGTGEEVEPLLQRVRDTELAHVLRQGVGYWHTEMSAADRGVVEQLYDMGLVRLVVCTQRDVELLPLRAPVVSVLGIEVPRRGASAYSQGELLALERLTASPAGGGGVGTFVVVCPRRDAERVEHWLSEPVVLESEMGASPPALAALLHEVRAKRVASRSDVVAWLGALYVAVRMRANPSYYDVAADHVPAEAFGVSAGLSRLADALVASGEALGVLVGTNGVELTRLGRALSELGGLERLMALQEEGAVWRQAPDRVKHAKVSAGDAQRRLGELEALDEVADALRAATPKSMLDAVGLGRLSKAAEKRSAEPDEGKDATANGTSAAADDAPSPGDGPKKPGAETAAGVPNGKAPERRSAASTLAPLLYASWLGMASQGGAQRTTEAVLRAGGVQAAALVAEARDALLCTLATEPR